MATSAPVLYANTHHPELKVEYPNWTDRHKQIIKRWRGLSVDIKTPFNQKARENRTTLRMKKTQQVRKIIYCLTYVGKHLTEASLWAILGFVQFLI